MGAKFANVKSACSQWLPLKHDVTFKLGMPSPTESAVILTFFKRRRGVNAQKCCKLYGQPKIDIKRFWGRKVNTLMN